MKEFILLEVRFRVEPCSAVQFLVLGFGRVSAGYQNFELSVEY